ncbi:MAG: PHP-associated domain-containing protein [Anaerolineae bacterium]|nr:PHP domain-containing protein [Thermoflexus sp.]MDW8064031.1 PHP-associated domain-containing protein [Anaerolineae bacterium]
MWRVELHAHTLYSPDSLVSLEDFLTACRRKGLDRVAVTDHNTIEGALRLKERAPDLIIIGEEIRTQEGEVLAYFIEREIPKGLPMRETVERVREQGGIVALPHPCDRARGLAMGQEIIQAMIPLVDAIEVFNARCVFPRDNARAAALAARFNKPGFSGSDAHTLEELGRAWTALPPFEDAAGFLQALSQAQPTRRLSPFWVHLISLWAKWHRTHRR